MCEERYVFDIIADRFLLYPLAFVRYFRLQKEEEIEQAEDEPLEEGQFEEAVPEATVEV